MAAQRSRSNPSVAHSTEKGGCASSKTSDSFVSVPVLYLLLKN